MTVFEPCRHPSFLDLTMQRSLSPMPATRCPSPYSIAESAYSSPYPATPEWAQDMYSREEIAHNCPFNINTCKGCDGLTIEEHYDDRVERQSHLSVLSSFRDDMASRARSTTPASSLMSFNSPDANRMQLKEEFLKLYFPAGFTGNDADFMYSQFLARESLQSLGPTMNAAVEVLSLVQLGTTYSDRRLIGEAQMRYQAAVSSLGRDLMHDSAMYDDGVLGAIYLLGFCEIYQPLSQGGNPWPIHHSSLRDLLLTRGPKGTYSRFAQLLLYNFRHVAAIVGCTTRKSVAFAGEAWKRCSALSDGLMSALSEQIISLPAVLERADIAMSRQALHTNELLGILMELINLERETQAWLLSWYSSFDRMPYWLDNVSEFRSFDQHTVGAPDIFPKAIRFPSYRHASAQITYWIGLLQMKQTIYEINRLYHGNALPRSEASLIAEATEYADNLCQAVAWLCQPQFGFCGTTRAMGPLHYAAKWYGKHADLPKIAWCEKVSQSLVAGSSISCLFHNPLTAWKPPPLVFVSGAEDFNLIGDDSDGSEDVLPPAR